MRCTAAVTSVFATAAVWFISPSTAAAQIAPCDPASAPVAAFKGLPDQLITGRDHVFSIDGESSAGWSSSDFAVTMSENGAAFWSGTVGQYGFEEDRLFIRSDPGDAPLTVSATYTEYRLDAVYPQPSTCQRLIAKTMAAVPGRPLPVPRVRGRFEEGQFILRRPRNCAASYAAEPVAVSVKPKRGRRWATLAVADQCVGWHGSASGPRFRLKPLAGDPATLRFVPRTRARDGREDFSFKLSRAIVSNAGAVTLGRILRRGVLRVTTSHYPRERVYGFKPNGKINDRYWNYCVNEGKKVWMHNGNPYCIDPALTYRKVRLRR